MKVSVITAVWNNKETIEDAINSVISQSYEDIEYIVIDGNSNDGTSDIIKNFSSQISIVIREPDEGIYDALNKGIEKSTGDIIAFLHSDDLYPHKNVISNIVKKFEENIHGIYGDLVYVDKLNIHKVYRYWRSSEFSPSNLNRGWMPPHPTLFLRKDVYKTYGNFDTNLNISADYDFMLRILSKDINVKYFPEVLYRMRIGGVSNRNIKTFFKNQLKIYIQ